MHIALIAPLVSPIAPPFLGGAQVLVHDLAAGLARRGHTVTLYAAEDSAVPGVRTAPLGIDAAELQLARFDPGAAQVADDIFFTQAHHFLRICLHISQHAGEYDLVHAHAYDWPAFTFGALLPLPMLHTLHLPASNPTILTALADLQRSAPNTHLATVSRACAATYAPGVPVETIIYNGIDVDAIPFGAEPTSEPYLLFAGRMAPEKGVVDALAIARAAGQRLLLAGGIYDAHYYEEQVRPLLSELEQEGLAEHVGPVPRERLWTLMAGATAVLVPSHWKEPFGIVPAEAQAAGAPVVGYAIGALPEVVAEGETGWLVPFSDLAGAAEAVGRVRTISRTACRARVVERFSIGAMLDAHERVYAELTAGGQR